jgi:ABC-2 type transport system permease protein
MAGVLVPWLDPTVWRSAAAMAPLYLVFPGMLAASVGADAFAGERERRTLETLLATPLADGAVFVGKALTAILFSAVVSTVALLCSIITVSLSHKGGPFPPQLHVAALLGGAIGVASISTAVSIFVSMRVAVARSAQQMSSVVSLVVGGATVAVIAELGIPFDWATLPRIDAWIVAAGVIALRAAMRSFRRDRMFDDR